MKYLRSLFLGLALFLATCSSLPAQSNLDKLENIFLQLSEISMLDWQDYQSTKDSLEKETKAFNDFKARVRKLGLCTCRQ